MAASTPADSEAEPSGATSAEAAQAAERTAGGNEIIAGDIAKMYAKLQVIQSRNRATHGPCQPPT